MRMNTKKEKMYEAPATTVVEVNTECMICISTTMFVILGTDAGVEPSVDAVENYTGQSAQNW